MAITRLDNEALRAELQKTQDALEAALRECQDKDCKYSQLLTTLRCHKVDHSRVVETGGVQDIKQEHRRQIRDWIRAADQDEDGDEKDEEAD